MMLLNTKLTHILIPKNVNFEVEKVTFNQENITKIVVFLRTSNSEEYKIQNFFHYTFSSNIIVQKFWKQTNSLNLYISLKSNAVYKLFELEKKLFLNKLFGLISTYKKILIISGIGFRFNLLTNVTATDEKDNLIQVIAGFSHINFVVIPTKISCILESPTKLILESPDKNLLGQFAAQIKQLKPVELFKGKGIRYENEFIKLKSYKKTK